MRLPFILMLTFFSFSLMAQIESEIRNYVDSSELIIKNGRRLLVKSLEDEDLKKANQVYTYLINTSGTGVCRAFSYDEQLCLSLILENYLLWIDQAHNFRQLFDTYDNAQTENMYPALQLYVAKHRDELSTRIAKAGLSEEDKDVLQLFLHLVAANQADESYNQMLKDFKREYPKTRYAVYLSDYLPRVRVKGGSAFGMGVSGIFPTDKLAAGFSSNAGFNMSWDFNINDVYTSLYMQAGALSVNTPFSMFNDSQTINFDRGDSFSYFDGGLIMGYFVVRSKYLHLAPFGALMGASLTSNLYNNPDDEKYEVKIFNTFSYGVGLKTELKLFEYDVRNFYGYGYGEKSYFSLKTEVGYNVLTKHNFEGFRGNVAYVRATLMWGFGSF